MAKSPANKQWWLMLAIKDKEYGDLSDSGRGRTCRQIQGGILQMSRDRMYRRENKP